MGIFVDAMLNLLLDEVSFNCGTADKACKMLTRDLRDLVMLSYAQYSCVDRPSND